MGNYNYALLAAIAAFWSQTAIAGQQSETAVESETPLNPAISLSPERLQLAREIVERIDVRGQLEQSRELMRPVMVSALLGELSSTANGRLTLATIERYFEGGSQAFSQEFATRFMARFEQYFPEMADALAEFYAAQLTEEQLEAALAFFSSDVGGAWVRASLASQTQLSEVAGRFGERAATEVGEEMFAQLEELAGADTGE